MIEQHSRPSGPSLVEAVLARWLVMASGREYVLDSYQPHVERGRTDAAATGADSAEEADPSYVEDPPVEGLKVDDRFPALGRFGRLLEIGAGHLTAAHAAYTEQGRQAVVQARALAAFAEARPEEPPAVLSTGVDGERGTAEQVRHDGGVTALAGEALRQRWIEAVVVEGERFGILAQELVSGMTGVGDNLDAPVPWLAEWRVRDLIGHLGRVHRWATHIVRAGTTERPPPEAMQTPPADENLLEWYETGLVELVATLRTTPPDAPAWHMSPTAEKVASSWARRQAHELIVHRMDLEAAAGVAHEPVDADLAEDGVDELLTVVVPRWAHAEPLVSADATVGVTSTDTGRSWSVTVVRGSVTVTEPRTGTEVAHLRGNAIALLLHLWGRPGEVTVDGDAAAEAILRGR